MNSKNNRVNHDFQIVHFLVGSCHTADGAYSLLCDLREDRDTALKASLASGLREQAKAIRARARLKSDDQAERLEAEADLVEIAAFEESRDRNIAGARAELACIDDCIERIQPLRKFKHLQDPKAHEAAQLDEWRLELIHRAENQLLTTGTIAPDHFATMRMHPSFNDELLPLIDGLTAQLNAPEGRRKLLDRIASKSFAFPQLPQKGNS